MLADFILKVIGEPSAAYPDPVTKWAVISAFLTDLLVPYGQILIFFLPFLIIKLKKNWRFTKKNMFIAIIVGALLAYGVFLFDNWLLFWGQDAAFKAIYEN